MESVIASLPLVARNDIVYVYSTETSNSLKYAMDELFVKYVFGMFKCQIKKFRVHSLLDTKKSRLTCLGIFFFFFEIF